MKRPAKRKAPRSQRSRAVRKHISAEDRAANRALVKAAEFYMIGALCHMVASWAPGSDRITWCEALPSFLRPKEKT
jgi:hypothetical protein